MTRPLRSGLATAVAATLSGVLAACGGDTGSSADASAGDTVKITFIADTSGAAAYLGKDFAAGAEYAVNKINADGGVGGRNLELEAVDSASDQATAVGAMTKAARSDSSAVLYALLSQNALAMAPVAQREKVPFIVGQSSVDGITQAGDYVYRTSTSEGTYYEPMLKTLADSGAKSTAILYASDNPTAVTNATKTLPAIAKKLGLEITDTVPVKTDETDYSQAASRIADGNPDVVADLVFGPAVTTSIKALRGAGFDGPLYGSMAFGAGALAPAGPAAADTYYPSSFIPADDLPWDSGIEFAKAYEAETGDEPTFAAASGHDQVIFLATALEQIGDGDVTRASIKDALADVATKGFTGATGDPVAFDDVRVAKAPGVLVRWDGKKETVAKEQPVPLLPAK